MDKVEHADTPGAGSLRRRYLLLTGFVVVLIVVGAGLATHLVNSATRDNAQALELRERVAQLTADISDAVWSAEFGLQDLLITPRPEHEQTIVSSLERAHALAERLQEDPLIRRSALADHSNDLTSALATLRTRFERLIGLRQDPGWVYPALPFIEGSSLQANIGFETAADLALAEVRAEHEHPYASGLYRQLDETRDLWRRMVLNFRAILIRFAGLHDTDPSPQEQNVEQLYDLVQERLDTLERRDRDEPLGFQTTESINIMRDSANRWYEDFQQIKSLRRSSSWRADIGYVDEQIRPALNDVFANLQELDSRIADWSRRNMAAVERTAMQLTWHLWLLAAVAMVLVWIGYLVLDRYLLNPIRQVVSALNAETYESSAERLPPAQSQEAEQLIAAFEKMRDQVHSRQQALEHQALHDTLTGLPNRALLHDRLEQAIKEHERLGSSAALLVLDLDRFKEINDTLGHHIGDRILQQVSRRLEGLLRSSDTIARLGGDEFALVLPDTEAASAHQLAEKVAGALDKVFDVEEHHLYVGASIGIAMYPEHGVDPATLIRHADVAMYLAKRSNRSVAAYDRSQDEHSVDQLALVADLREALHADQLALHYQPKIDIASQTLVGAEALLRWDHPRHGLIPPQRLVRLAERTGLITTLTLWVIQRALSDYRRWGACRADSRVAVNLSAWDLQDLRLPEKLRRLLEQAKLPAETLILEITESAVMTEPLRAREVLQEIDRMGIHVSVDDFGTGFSSLGHLKLLPVTELKIDKSFVMDMLRDENDAVIVRSTIDLAHNLGLTVTAEGVEDDGVYARLAELRCDRAQGFGIGRPMPLETFVDWLQSRTPGADHGSGRRA